jgi:hypothetical protein
MWLYNTGVFFQLFFVFVFFIFMLDWGRWRLCVYSGKRMHRLRQPIRIVYLSVWWQSNLLQHLHGFFFIIIQFLFPRSHLHGELLRNDVQLLHKMVGLQ